MASVAKWLRQWIVVPPFVGSIPIVRPLLYSDKLASSFNTEKLRVAQFLELPIPINTQYHQD